MRKYIISIAVAVLVVVIFDPSLGFAGTRHALLNFHYQGNSYYTPLDYCVVFLCSDPDSVVASGRILERSGTYYFEFDIIDGEDFGYGGARNYVRIWAYTDSIHQGKHITPFFPNGGELNLVFHFGADPNCYGTGGGVNPGGP